MYLTKHTNPAALDPRQITYLQGEGNYTQVYLTTGYKILYAINLGRLLQEHWPDLIRVHKSFAVSPAAIQGLVFDAQARVMVELQITMQCVAIRTELIPVARRALKSVRHQVRQLASPSSGSRPGLSS